MALYKYVYYYYYVGNDPASLDSPVPPDSPPPHAATALCSEEVSYAPRDVLLQPLAERTVQPLPEFDLLLIAAVQLGAIRTLDVIISSRY